MVRKALSITAVVLLFGFYFLHLLASHVQANGSILSQAQVAGIPQGYYSVGTAMTTFTPTPARARF